MNRTNEEYIKTMSFENKLVSSEGDFLGKKVLICSFDLTLG